MLQFPCGLPWPASMLHGWGRRVNGALFSLCERWLPFLPAVRESRRLHGQLHAMYEGMIDQMEARTSASQLPHCAAQMQGDMHESVR